MLSLSESYYGQTYSGLEINSPLWYVIRRDGRISRDENAVVQGILCPPSGMKDSRDKHKVLEHGERAVELFGRNRHVMGGVKLCHLAFRARLCYRRVHRRPLCPWMP